MSQENVVPFLCETQSDLLIESVQNWFGLTREDATTRIAKAAMDLALDEGIEKAVNHEYRDRTDERTGR